MSERIPLVSTIYGAAQAMGRKGGKARAKALSKRRRKEIAAMGGKAGLGKAKPRKRLRKTLFPPENNT